MNKIWPPWCFHKKRVRLSVQHGKWITIARATKSLFLTRQNIRSESINILMRAKIEWKMKSGVEFLALPAMGCLIPYDFVLLESHASAHVNVYKHCKYRPFFLSLYDCSCKTKQVANNNSTGTLIMANQIECHDRNFSEWSSTTPAVAF